MIKGITTLVLAVASASMMVAPGCKEGPDKTAQQFCNQSYSISPYQGVTCEERMTGKQNNSMKQYNCYIGCMDNSSHASILDAKKRFPEHAWERYREIDDKCNTVCPATMR